MEPTALVLLAPTAAAKATAVAAREASAAVVTVVGPDRKPAVAHSVGVGAPKSAR